MRGDRPAGQSLPRPADLGRLAVSVDRRHLPEGPPGRPHRLGRRHRRGRRQYRWPARGAGYGYRSFRGRDLLDGLPQEAGAARPARGQADRLRCPRGHQGGRLEDLHRDLAALPRPLHAQRAGPCRQKRPACRLGLHRHRLRPERCQGGKATVAPRRQALLAAMRPKRFISSGPRSQSSLP